MTSFTVNDRTYSPPDCPVVAICLDGSADEYLDCALARGRMPHLQGVSVSGYRGFWGVNVNDPLGGENAPSGPMYNRDGSVRSSWYDPVGWAGLDKVPTPTTIGPTAFTHSAIRC